MHKKMFFNNTKLIHEVKRKNKKNLISRLKSLSGNQLKILLSFSFYDSIFKSVYVSDGYIGGKLGLSREWVNRSKHKKLFSFLRVVNRGANRTCITSLRLNLLKDPDLLMYCINEIRALAGVFKYQFTRFLKISYMSIINGLKFRQKWGRDIEVLSKFSDLVCSEYLRSKKMSLKQEICLSVFPVSALEHAWSLFEGYPFGVSDKFRFIYSAARQYCVANGIEYMNHLSFWFFKITGLLYNIEFNKLGDSLTVAPKGNGCKRGQDASLVEKPKKREVDTSFFDFLAANPDIRESFCSE